MLLIFYYNFFYFYTVPGIFGQEEMFKKKHLCGFVQFVWSVCSIKKTKKEKNCMGPFTNFPREAKAYNCYIASKNTRKTKYSIIYSGRIRYFISNKQ